MNRLVIGDVGSGKTIVAFLSIYANYLSGYQSAFLAPTEILASQHFENIKKILKDIKVELLTSSTTKSNRNLQNKGNSVDVLYMSATPIPRTYALTIYGDMDISEIKTKPSGRKEIITKLFKEQDLKECLTIMLEEIKKGHQVYVVSPLVIQSGAFVSLAVTVAFAVSV